MSRYTVEVRSETEADPEGTIGYDPPLRTFFLTAFLTDGETEATELWLGGALEEFPTLEGLNLKARSMGYEVIGLKQADMIAMLAEASKKNPPSVGEYFGFVR